jgi:hypothetical protein
MWVSLILLGMLAPASAAEPAPVQRLSEAQIAQVLDEAAAKRETVEAAAPPPKADIHGEVGVAIGTGGYREIFGDAFIPFGDDGGATLSFSTQRQRGLERR